MSQTYSIYTFTTCALSLLHVCFMYAFSQGCAQDLLSRDRDEIRDPCLRDRDEIETFKILSETKIMFIVAPEIKFTVNSFSIFISHFAHCSKWDGQLPYRRDVRETFRAKAETRLETHVSETETRRCSFRDSRESRELQPLAETFSMMYGETYWQWKKKYTY